MADAYCQELLLSEQHKYIVTCASRAGEQKFEHDVILTSGNPEEGGCRVTIWLDEENPRLAVREAIQEIIVTPERFGETSSILAYHSPFIPVTLGDRLKFWFAGVLAWIFRFHR